MSSPIRVANNCVTNIKQTAWFSIAGLMLTIAPLWLMLATANTSQAQTTSSPADWTQFHRDNMQRWNPYETVLNVNNVGGLQLKWKTNPISYIQQQNYGVDIESSPAVVNGAVYFGSDGNGAGNGIMYALNASTVATVWSFATGISLLASPAVANGVVYGEQYGGSNLYALDASTGAQLWSYDIGSSVSSPAVVNGVVYVGGGNALYALNASSGALLWSYATGGAVWSSPAVVNGVVYVGSQDNHVYALNANTGTKLWSYATENAVKSSPAVVNGVVYVGSFDDNVYALNASTGAKLWRFLTGYHVESSPAVANGVVYVGSDDYNVYALNASTGAKLWSYATGNAVQSSPAVANGVVYIGSSDGNWYALNASTGAKLWSYSTGSACSICGPSSPTIVDGVLYINGEDGSGQMHIYAFSLGGASADLFLRIIPTLTTVYQGDLLTYAFPVWNLGPDAAAQEFLLTQVPAGTVFDSIRISGTPGLGTCGTYENIACFENSAMAPNTTWTVRLTVKVTAASGSVITESAATMSDTPDPNMANNMATVSVKVQ